VKVSALQNAQLPLQNILNATLTPPHVYALHLCSTTLNLFKKGLLNCALDRITQNNDSATHYF